MGEVRIKGKKYQVKEEPGTGFYALPGICYNPKCTVCGNFQLKTTMIIVEGPC